MSYDDTTHPSQLETPRPISGALLHESPMSIDSLYDEINKLPIDDRVALVQRLLGKQSGMTVIFGSNNFTSNNFAIQMGGEGDGEWQDKLNELPTETIARLLEAIAARIERDR